MHMADILVSTPVSVATIVAATGTLGYAIKKVAKEENESLTIKMGIFGALVFAAQMVNFTIPGTGASGHLVGTILLASLLGAFPSFIVISSILLIQALLFADGGLLAWGCNVINMGMFGSFVAYPLIVKPILEKKLDTKNIMFASILASVLSLQLGALSVVIESSLSHTNTLPIFRFLALMQSIHLLIGLVEGVITGLVLKFLYQAKPELLDTKYETSNKFSKNVKVSLSAIIIATATVLPLFASGNPDGLEWAMGKIGLDQLSNKSIMSSFATMIQDKLSILPDYNFISTNNSFGTVISGLLGITLMFGIFYLISKTKKGYKNR